MYQNLIRRCSMCDKEKQYTSILEYIVVHRKCIIVLVMHTYTNQI